MKNAILISVVCCFSSLLTGCGSQVPNFVIPDEPHATASLVNRIANHVKCEIREAVLKSIDYDNKNALQQPDHKRRISWLDGWAADVSLTLTVNEKSAVSPSAKYTSPLSAAASFVLDGGINESNEVNRIEKIDFYFEFSDFVKNRYKYANRKSGCIENGGFMIDGDLKFENMIDDLVFPYFIPESVGLRPPKTLSDEVQFILSYGGNISPGFNLVRVNVNGDGSLLNASRSRTDDVVVSIGPADPGNPGEPSEALLAAHSDAILRSSFLNALTTSR